MSVEYIPYEALSRVEAGEIMEHLPSVLRGLTAEQVSTVQELVADGYARGIGAGFAISDLVGPDPAGPVEAYVAGYEQAKQETGEQ